MAQRVQEAEKSKTAGRTFRYDLLRSTMTGVLETGFSTFGLLVAIRVFGAPESFKGSLAAGMSAGLLIVPWVMVIAARSRLTVTTFGACLMVMSAICIAGAAMAEGTTS